MTPKAASRKEHVRPRHWWLGGYGGGGYGGYGDDDGGFGFHGRSARKSKAAQRREDTAREVFTEALEETPMGKNDSVTLTSLLKPSNHLTQAVWSDFSKWTKSHEGCSVKRRAASDEEKKDHGESGRRRIEHGTSLTVPRLDAFAPRCSSPRQNLLGRRHDLAEGSEHQQGEGCQAQGCNLVGRRRRARHQEGAKKSEKKAK